MGGVRVDDLNALNSVLHNFGFKAKKIIKEKSYYICSTERGIKVVRKSFDSCEHIMFQHEVKEQLFANGFAFTDRFYLSQQNTPYVQTDDGVYIMTGLFDYREVSFTLKSDAVLAASALSLFHVSSRGEKTSGQLFCGSENTLSTFKKGEEYLASIKKGLSSQKRLSDFDVLFLKSYEFYMAKIHEAIALLDDNLLEEKRRQAQKQNNVCHGLVKEENVLLNGNDVYFVGFSAASIDYGLFDLSKLIKRILKSISSANDKTVVPVQDVLTAYDKNIRLEKEEIVLLHALLKYPSRFLKICGQYYSKKRSFTPNAINNRMEALVSNKEIQDWYIDTLSVL